MTPPNRRRAPRGARRPSPRFGSAALAVPGGALEGALIGLQFAGLDTLVQAYQLRGSGIDSWSGFALLEVALAIAIGCVIGAFVGILVSAALAAAWAARLGVIAATAIGTATASLAVTALLLLWLGPSAQLVALAAYATVRAAADILLLVTLADAPRRICRVPHA